MDAMDLFTPNQGRRMPPDARREMLIAATVRLVAEHGPKVTTKQIADAAGVAEGTIFRAFSDKETLVQAAMARCLDQAPLLASLATVDPALPVRERLLAAVEILQEYAITMFNLVIKHGPPIDLKALQTGRERDYTDLEQQIIRILEPDRERFRCPLPEVEQIMRILTLGGSHPILSGGRILTPDEIVSALLEGTLRPC